MKKTINFYSMLEEKYLPIELINYIHSYNFNYKVSSDDEYKKLVLHVLKKIDLNSLRKTGNVDVWEKGWLENLNEFIKTNDLQSLVPKYMHSDEMKRYNNNYIKPDDPNLEMNVLLILMKWVSLKYLNNCSGVFDFGCGSVYNLSKLYEMCPNQNIHGLDWTDASLEIINNVNRIYNYNIQGHKFDIFNPDFNLNISNRDAIFTVGCLEQTYDNFHNFVDFVLLKKPKIVCNFEALLELYDENNLLDYLSIKFHTQRNYLTGYYPYLKQLEKENKIRILKAKRINFGNLFHEGWSILIWEIL